MTQRQQTNQIQLADGLQAGQGLAGGLLKDDKMKAEFTSMLTNFSSMAEQYSRFGQNLNENGLWHTLFKHKASPTNAPAR